MKTKILLAGMCLSLAACESMDLVPKSQGNTESWYTSETELRLASNDFYILGYWQEPLSSSEQWSDNTTYRQTNRNPGSGGTVAAIIQTYCPHQHNARKYSQGKGCCDRGSL